MQLHTVMVLMAVLVAMEEMAMTQVKVVTVVLEVPFEFLFPKPTLISLCSMVPPSILPEEGVQLDCPRAGPGRPSANFAGPGPGP